MFETDQQTCMAGTSSQCHIEILDNYFRLIPCIDKVIRTPHFCKTQRAKSDGYTRVEIRAGTKKLPEIISDLPAGKYKF